MRIRLRQEPLNGAAAPIALGPGAEFDLIRSFLRNATTGHALPEHVRVGPGDDCAIVRGEGIAVSVDMAVEDVHFRRAWIEPEEIGYRSVAAALSDLAAVAAAPIGVFVALAVAEADRDEFAARVMEGAQAAAAGVRAVLLGGDVTRSPGPLVLDAVVLGNALRPVLRTGASAGDTLWVTGELGAAAAAVRAWTEGRVPEPAARLAYALPAPRIAEARWLAERQALNALIDLSDGLAGDAGHIAAASGVRIILDAASVPIHPVVRAAAGDGEEALRKVRILANRTPHITKAARREANRALDILERQVTLNRVNATGASQAIELLNRAHASLTFSLLRDPGFVDRFSPALRLLGLRGIGQRLDEVSHSVMAEPIPGPDADRGHRDELPPEERVDQFGNPLPPPPGYYSGY